jgi:uncharacterized protein YfaS (alpha-2-macroglobulin family)
VWFRVPASLEAAANDGERWRYVMHELEQIDAERALSAKSILAGQFMQWFSVQTLAGVVPLGSGAKDDLAKTKTGIMALHTLADDETCVKLASGARRLKLPEEFQFLRLQRELAASGPERLQSRAGRSNVISELLMRRQFRRAAAFIEESLPSEDNKDNRRMLQDQLEQITGHWGRFETAPAQPAGRKATIPFTFRNADKTTVTARKVDVEKLLAETEAYFRSEPRGDRSDDRQNVQTLGHRLIQRGPDKFLGKVIAEWTLALQPAPDHWDRQIDLETPLEEAGAYWIEARFEGGHAARALLWIEGLTLVESRGPESARWFVCDAVSGAPVRGAKLRFFGYRQQWVEQRRSARSPRYVWSFKELTAESDERGEVTFPKSAFEDKAGSYSFQWLVTARDDQGRTAHHGFENLYFNRAYDRSRAARYYTITDRPAYRPGQEVKWKTWARVVDYADTFDTNPYKGKSLSFEILNPRREKVVEKTIIADEHGGIDDTFQLPEDATLGTWFIRIGDRVQHNFQVEEYKKPEFEVKVDAPEKPIALGDTFEAKVKAEYYFGGPVKEGRVKYKVLRTQHHDRWQPYGPWDWLYGRGYAMHSTAYRWYPGATRWCSFGSMFWGRPVDLNPEVVSEGELPIGADGTLAIKVDTAAAKELHGDVDHHYAITAEVTDASRRTISGNGAVLAARKPFEVLLWLDGGFFRTGELARAQLSARTLDGRAVTTAGKLRVLRVTYAADGTPKEEELDAFDLKTGDSVVSQTFKWNRAGQYRLSAIFKDADGHEEEGSCFTLVRGEDEEGTNGLRFDDLELLTAKTEYRPGEEVEVMVNTNRVGSTVALFVRAASGVYPAPVWLQMDGKSAVHRFTLQSGDRPNIWLEAFTVHGAKVHRVTRQILVPPQDRIATVELKPDRKDYRPRDKATAILRVKTTEGKPLAGEVVITAYDKSLEYISGGSNQPDIRPFFWGWKREHHSQLVEFLRWSHGGLVKDKEKSMQPLGLWGGFDGFVNYGATISTSGSSSLILHSSFSGRISGNLSRSGYFGMAGAGFESGSGVAAPGARGGAVAVTPDSIDGLLASSSLAKSGAGRWVDLNESTKLNILTTPGLEFAQVAMIRSKLADSAVWIANAKTNEAGEATVNFEMPDNLTTWKLRAWVMGSRSEVGEASVEVVTNKDVMVRLQSPRFFVEKDEAVLSANVHNELDQPQTVKGVIELEGGTLELLDGVVAEQQAEVPARGEKRFDWRVRALKEGEAKVRVKALAQGDSDAMEMSFPVHIHGALRTESWSLALKSGQADGAIKFSVPAERRVADSKLEVRCSPTLAMAMVDTLPYLADYPHGCTEQTLNRFVPTVVTLQVLKDLGINLSDLKGKDVNLNAQELGNPADRAKRWQGKDEEGKPRKPVFSEDKVQHMARVGLARLAAMRSDDGGWGWFPGGRESSAHITAIVVRGLLTAKHAGLKVDDGLIERGAQWLERHEERELRLLRLPEKHDDHKEHPDNEDALVHITLVDCGKGDKDMRARLFASRTHLSRMNVALLGIALHKSNQSEDRNMCLRNLRQYVKEDEENQTAWVDLGETASWWRWWDDRVETQAALLRLLCAVEPKGKLAPRLAKHLLNNRQHGGAWSSTRSTAAVIEALATFVKASGEAQPDLKLTLLVDGKVHREVTVTRENLFTADASLTLAGDELATGDHTIEFRKEGSSPLYANAYLSVFSKEDMIRAAGLEVKVARKFYKLTEEKKATLVAGSRGQPLKEQGVKYARTELQSGDPIRSGDLVEVELTVDSKNDYEYVLLEDPKPAGFEPVSVRSGWNYDGLAAYQEFRDARVCFYAERLPQGKSVLHYRTRVEVPGRFSALPTQAEAMYAPELRANADEWKAVIGESE